MSNFSFDISKFLYAAIGILLVIITALALFIRKNAFIIPTTPQVISPTQVILPTGSIATSSAEITIVPIN